MAFRTLHNLAEFEQSLTDSVASIYYFSHEQCNVCKVLKPKVQELAETFFPEMQIFDIDVILSPEISAQLSIFVSPTLLVYFDGREFYRKSRAFGIDELKNEISRPYSMIFS